MKKGFFITVEGTDGCGKTTQMKLIENYLRAKGFDVVMTREPGGTRIGEKIRAIILDVQNAEMSDISEMLLYASARAQLVAEVVKPAIAAGKVVVCDRFVDSSFVYQGFGRGIDIQVIESVNKIAMDGIMPDITFFFDLNPETALRRRIMSGGADRIENENIEFHMKVYEGYKTLASLYPDRIKPIDGGRDVEAVFHDVRNWLDKLVGS